MDLTPFNVYFIHHDVMDSVQVRPCCREDNVVDYAIWEKNELAFTITPHAGTQKWVVALKNADDDIDDELVQLIGAQIEKKMVDENE